MADGSKTKKELQQELHELREQLAEYQSGGRIYGEIEDRLKTTIHDLQVHQEELKAQNEELNAARHELDASHKRYHDLFNFAPVGYFIIRKDTIIEQVNVTGANMIDKSYDKVVGKPFMLFVAPDSRKMLQAHFHSVFKGRVVEQEVEFIGPKGKALHVLLRSDPVNNSGDGINACRTAAIDITARKSMEKTLIDLKNEAERANKAKSVFLSSMSHEIRTPLNAVIGFSDLLLLGKEPLLDKQRLLLNHIINAGNHLLKLIDDIIDLSMIESENINIKMESIEVDIIERIVMASVSSMADEKGIGLERNPAEDQYFVMADRTRLQQVLINLLANAIKYNRADGKVILSHKLIGKNRLRFSVTDTGPGIPHDKLETAFNPFDRLGIESLNIKGAGIGLAIVRRLVELMGGAVGVESQVGRGSVFYIDLPVGKKPEQMYRYAMPPVNAQAATSPAKKRKVLYIEDDDLNLRLVKSALEDHRPNIEIACATNPVAGFRIAGEIKPDLILLDINMPGMDGFAVLERLRELNHTACVPVIAITGAAMTTDVEKGFAAGFSDYLTKPFHIKQFLMVVDNALAAIE